MGFQELEMVHHRVIGEPELADDANTLCLGLHPAELDALIGLVELHPIEHAEKVEMPPGPAELAVGGKLEPDLLLFRDDLLDLTVLDRLELGRRDRALLPLGTGLLEGCGSQ